MNKVRSWAEIDLNCLVHNLKEIRKLIDKKTRVMAVVKADAYGHGACKTAEVLAESGVDRLAVATLDEAIQLARYGLDLPIQILGHTFPEKVSEILDYKLIQSVFNFELAEALSYEAQKRGTRAKIHIVVNTGMNRVGFPANEHGVEEVSRIYALDAIDVEGIMTHFSSADEESSDYTYRQFKLFMDFCSSLEKREIRIPIKHVSNSAAIIRYPEMNLDMVRPGIVLYGLYPSSNLKSPLLGLKPVMAWKANVVSVNHLAENEYISYGRTFKTERESVIATIPVGYADGYSRSLSNKCRILIKGEFAPIIGTICMDQFMVDITDLKSDVLVGDEVMLFGKNGYAELPVEIIAEGLGTINYEVVSRLGMRIPRVYIKDGNVVNVVNNLVKETANGGLL
jgi:alanine racemase